MTAVGTLIAGFFLVFQVVLWGVQGNVESIQGSVESIQEDIRRLAAEDSTNFRGLKIEVSGLRGDLGGLRDEVSGLRSDFLSAFGQGSVRYSVCEALCSLVDEPFAEDDSELCLCL